VKEKLYSVVYEDFYGKEQSSAIHGADAEDAKQKFRYTFKYVEVIRQAINEGYIKHQPSIIKVTRL